ncbi:hypothetical protein ACLBYD_15765 [Rhodococcus sp. C26F]
MRTDSHPVCTGIAGATTIVAATLLAPTGVVSILQGVSAIVADELFLVGPQYTYSLDVTPWGWFI